MKEETLEDILFFRRKTVERHGNFEEVRLIAFEGPGADDGPLEVAHDVIVADRDGVLAALGKILRALEADTAHAQVTELGHIHGNDPAFDLSVNRFSLVFSVFHACPLKPVEPCYQNQAALSITPLTPVPLAYCRENG